MFIKVPDVLSPYNCQAIAWGHTSVEDDPRFSNVDQETFIRRYMTTKGRKDLLYPKDGRSPKAIQERVADWISKTGIASRVFFDGPTSDMAVIAAKNCLEKAGVLPSQLDYIIGGTNTGPGYPTLADYVKLGLGDNKAKAACKDVTEACPVGGVAIFDGWNMIRSGACEYVLVAVSEKATSLIHPDRWLGSNLFGDAAFAVLLKRSDIESFQFFDQHSMPFDGNINRVIKTEYGFKQDGPEVHKFVGRDVVPTLIRAVAYAGINPANIKHLVPHQPSGKTLDFFFKKIAAAWTDFAGVKHRSVEFTGNTSGASSGHIISTKIDAGIIKPGDLLVACLFGSGLSIFNYGIRI